MQFAYRQMTQEQIAQHIADGFPPQAEYVAFRLEKGPDGYVRPVPATPIHLLRAPLADAR